MRIQLAAATFVTLGALGMANTAIADPIGGPDSDCGTCQGATYWLEEKPLGGSTFQVNLFIDTSTLDLPGAVAIADVAPKVSNSLTSASLITAPTGSVVGDWLDHANVGLNAGGCSGGGSGFDCTAWTGLVTGGVGVPIGGLLEWQWNMVLGGAVQDPGSIKVRYVDANGNKIGDLVSEDIPVQRCDLPEGCGPKKIPEPSALALLGLVGIGL